MLRFFWFLENNSVMSASLSIVCVGKGGPEAFLAGLSGEVEKDRRHWDKTWAAREVSGVYVREAVDSNCRIP